VAMRTTIATVKTKKKTRKPASTRGNVNEKKERPVLRL